MHGQARALERLAAILGPDELLAHPGTDVTTDSHARVTGAVLALIRPRSIEALSHAIAFCAAERLPVVPQGGRTGLVGGAVPQSTRAIAVDMSALNRIRSIVVKDRLVIVEAGMVLADLQARLEPMGLRFPVHIGSHKACQLGGMAATNAGGVTAVRFGSMRDRVLGLEVVLPSGGIWSGLRSVRKDNSGYDLKQCFIGSEGTLGVISALALSVEPLARSRATAMAGLSSVRHLVETFEEIRSDLGEFLSAFELVSSAGFRYARRTDPMLPNLFAGEHEAFVLVEAEAICSLDLEALLHATLLGGIERGHLTEVHVASSLAQRSAMWRIRELTPWAGASSLQFDVSVPISAIGEFLGTLELQLKQAHDWAEINAFGHVGDGNIHYHVCAPEAGQVAALHEKSDLIADLVHAEAMRLQGSFSAEHGIGLTRRRDFRRYKDPQEVALMYNLKRTFDPLGIMNPGKMLA